MRSQTITHIGLNASIYTHSKISTAMSLPIEVSMVYCSGYTAIYSACTTGQEGMWRTRDHARLIRGFRDHAWDLRSLAGNFRQAPSR